MSEEYGLASFIRERVQKLRTVVQKQSVVVSKHVHDRNLPLIAYYK